MTNGEAIRLVKRMAEQYSQPIDVAMAQRYAEALVELDAAAGQKLLELFVATEPRLPTLATLRESVARFRRADLPEPELAWGEVSGALRRIGLSRVPTWSCPEVAQAVADIGGWGNLCRSELPAADRRAFIDAYRCHWKAALEQAKPGTRIATLRDQLRAELGGEAAPLKQLGDGNGDDAK